MRDTHLVESLHIDIDFDNLPSGLHDGEAAQACLATFMRGTALEIVDAVFDAALPSEDVWRLDRLDVDLGRIVVEDAQDWQTQWARALRARLQRLLDELRDAPADAMGDRDARHPMHRRQSELETLLFFLRHGRLPWYGRGRRGDDPRELARGVLRQSTRELVAALREVGDRPRLLRRLAAQFDGQWLTDLVRALLPTEPTAVARLLEVVQRARRPGRADDDASVTRLWEAVLDQALSEGTTTQRPDMAVTRLQLQLALEPDTGFLAPDDPLLGTASAWRRLLHDDRAWLKATLQRLGRSQPLERRLARTLTSDLLPEVASLWLATEQTAAVTGWISAAVAQAPPSAAHDRDYGRDLWEAALSHFLSGGGDAAFDRRRFARKLLRRVGTPSRPVATDNPTRAAPSDDARLRAGPTWWTLLRDDPDAMRSTLQRHIRHGEAACRQLAHDWSGDMLLEAACLQAPQARQLIAAAVCSPPLDAGARERRWACTLQYVYAREGTGPVDERAYMKCLARDAARVEGRSFDHIVARWNSAVQSADAAASWFDRIVEVNAAANTSVAPPSTAVTLQRDDIVATPLAPPAPNGLATAGAAAPEAARSLAERVDPAPPQAPQVATARSFAVRVVAALAALAGTLGRRVSRVFSSDPLARPVIANAPDATLPMAIDNAGLVLIGPYLPRLFEALGLLAGGRFVDDRARERAVYLLQYAVDGTRDAAPESRLTLNKVLCGLEPATCVDRRFTISARECTLVDGLLGAVIVHWSILGRTTVEGLRETFLQRSGQLDRRPDDGWTLTVEPGSFDILIDRLPWGYAMQKHPWMNEVLHVDWR